MSNFTVDPKKAILITNNHITELNHSRALDLQQDGQNLSVKKSSLHGAQSNSQQNYFNKSLICH